MAAVGTYESLTAVGPDDLLIEAAAALGLVDHLAELDAVGFTVVPPEKVATSVFLDALREAVLALHRRRKADPHARARQEMMAGAGAGELMQLALWENPIFETALMNPVVQTLARAMSGHCCRVSLFCPTVKPKGGSSLGFHCDTEMSEPYPPVPQVCNVTYALSDYSEEAGSTLFVPGSHRLLRQPHGSEVEGRFGVSGVAGSLAMAAAVPVRCRAGSLIAWSGLTWHGAAPRTIDGERVSILMYFCRWYLQPQENFREHVPPGTLERHGPRFAQLLDVVRGWGPKDPTHDPATVFAGRTIYPILDVARP